MLHKILLNVLSGLLNAFIFFYSAYKFIAARLKTKTKMLYVITTNSERIRIRNFIAILKQ